MPTCHGHADKLRQQPGWLESAALITSEIGFCPWRISGMMLVVNLLRCKSLGSGVILFAGVLAAIVLKVLQCACACEASQ